MPPVPATVATRGARGELRRQVLASVLIDVGDPDWSASLPPSEKASRRRRSVGSGGPGGGHGLRLRRRRHPDSPRHAQTS